MNQLKSYKNGFLSRGLPEGSKAALQRNTTAIVHLRLSHLEWQINLDSIILNLSWPTNSLFSTVTLTYSVEKDSRIFDSRYEQKVCHRCAKKSTTSFTTTLSKMAAATQFNSFMYTENINIFYRFFTHKNLHYIYERINIQQR